MSNIDEKDIIKRFEAISEFKPAPEIAARDIARVRQKLSEQDGGQGTGHQSIWRIIMKSRMTRLAAGAVIIVVVILSITFLDKSVTPAYAVEQTLKAYDGIRYLHAYYYSCTVHKIPKEAWIQYDENGDVENIRGNLYNVAGENKHCEMVWNEAATLIWKGHQNTFEIDEIGDYTPVMLGFAESIHPKQAIEHAYKDREEGKCQIEIQEGSRDNEPIKITARYLPGKYSTVTSLPEIHDVLVVDKKTKLVIRKEVYKVVEDRIELWGVYKDYNTEPFDPNIFDIEKEIPDDAIRIVHYNVDDVNEVGIDEGSLSDEEAGHVVIEEFFNALIGKDYKKAGLLFGGMPPNEVELEFGSFNVTRLVSIGDRVERGGGLPSHYPCVVEIKENGNLSQWEPKVRIGKVGPLRKINRLRIDAVFQ
ncbi:MAG TPA: hypothetical protein VMX13_00360 [Sedimentisphaerales bacterium]|nr:hypothetical protein [Sedimentisphaerales bacterium]